MKNKKVIGVPTMVNGNPKIIEFGTGKDITNMFRSIMINHAFRNDEILLLDEETGRAKRMNKAGFELEDIKQSQPTQQPMPQEQDPILNLIQNAYKIKPATLEMSDIKWKYLVRSALRGKNIMMVGPAGCGRHKQQKIFLRQPIVLSIILTWVQRKIQEQP